MIIDKIITKFLSVIFPKLRKARKEDLLNYKYKKLPRYAKCYCKSGKKYKHCHLSINSKDREVALLMTDKSGHVKLKLFDIKTAKVLLRGNNKKKIEVENTFDNYEVYMGAGDYAGNYHVNDISQSFSDKD